VLWAGAAGLLLATESLNFVMSRISMVDIFVAAFALAGFLFLALDREWIERRTPPPGELTPQEKEEAALLHLPPDRAPSPILRPWRLAAGLAFGAGVATKWSGVTAMLGGIILAVAWERTRRARLGFDTPLREALRDEGLGLMVFFVLVPVGVYVASYARWFVDHDYSVIEWWRLQSSMASFSIGLRSPHNYASRAWSWAIMARPVLYYYECVPFAGSDCGRVGSVLGMGNPAVFWGSLAALPYVLFSWVRKRDWRAGLVMVGFLAQYAPWYLAARTSFFFYMTPITPFQILAVAYALKDLSEVRIGVERTRALAPVAGFAVLASVAVFVYFLPILTGRVLSHQAWLNRMWFNSWI
jgi:dolichyl-phosphate-mannose-protein mannosyltransferase